MSELVKADQLMVSSFRGKPVRRTAANYFNGQDLANAGGKGRTHASDWIDSQQGQEYLRIAGEKLKSEISDLVRVVHGGPPAGVWMHPKIARRYAQVCSAELAWWVDELVEAKLDNLPVEKPEYHLSRYKELVGLTQEEHGERLTFCEGKIQNIEDDQDRLWEVTAEKGRSKPIPQEAAVRDRWAEKLGGKTEVLSKAGRIDIYVTGQWVVEVKDETKWKDAMGQVKAYSSHDPECRRMCVLFTPSGKRPYTTQGRRMIALQCNRESIQVWFDGDTTNYNYPIPTKQLFLFKS